MFSIRTTDYSVALPDSRQRLLEFDNARYTISHQPRGRGVSRKGKRHDERGLRFLAVLCMCLFVVAGCGDDKVTQPTPTPSTPAPTPAPTPTPTPPPAAPPALDSLVVNPGSVEGQNTPTATVTLTATAGAASWIPMNERNPPRGTLSGVPHPVP